jgi:hypothetical protein
MRHFACVGKDVVFGQTQEIIQLGNPVPHMHGFAIARLEFGEFQVSGDDPV